MDSWLVFRRDRVMLGQWTKRDNWSIKRFSKPPFIWSPPIRQEVLNVPKIGVTFHRICTQTFIQTWLQQYGRCAFFYSAHCSFSNPICFWSMWCRRTIIPGKIFTSFAKFQGSVSVNDIRFPIWLQELLQALLCFLRSFCFARIRLDPVGGQVLHHDCISMIVSRFTTFTENFVICCYQVTKFFSTRYGSAKSCTTTANRWLFRDSPLVIFRVLASFCSVSRRTQGHPKWAVNAALPTGPSASRITFSVTTITDGYARAGNRSTLTALTQAWLYIEPSPCGGVRPAGDPIDSDPGAVFEDDPHPRSDADRPLDSWVCRHTLEPTVLSRVSCRPSHLNVDRFHQPCLFS